MATASTEKFVKRMHGAVENAPRTMRSSVYFDREQKVRDANKLHDDKQESLKRMKVQMQARAGRRRKKRDAKKIKMHDAGRKKKNVRKMQHSYYNSEHEHYYKNMSNLLQSVLSGFTSTSIEKKKMSIAEDCDLWIEMEFLRTCGYWD